MKLNDFLDKINLTQYEKKVYLSLLRIGNSKSREISKESGVSYGRIYEILSKLDEKGLISTFSTEPKTFEAIEPKKSLEIFLQRKEDELYKLKNEISTLEMPEIIKKEKTKNEIIVLKGKEKQIEMISDIHNRAKKEILMIPGVYEPTSKRRLETLRVLNNNIKIKRIIRKVNDKNKDILEQSIALGEEIKFNHLSGLRLIVADNKESMLSIVDPKTKDRISIYSENKDFANSMSIFFKSLWKSSKSKE